MPGSSAPELAPAGASAVDVLVAANEAAPAAGFDWMGLVLMVVAMGAIMYFLVYRPQQREKAARETLLGSLVKGDEVVTAGGLHGTVVSVEGEVVKLDIGNKSPVTVDKVAIARKAGMPAPTDKK
jgi:preprotein translocase subunit YajC